MPSMGFHHGIMIQHLILFVNGELKMKTHRHKVSRPFLCNSIKLSQPDFSNFAEEPDSHASVILFSCFCAAEFKLGLD